MASKTKRRNYREIARAVNRDVLTEEQRELVRLFVDEGLSVGDIAERYGLSRQSIYCRLQQIFLDSEQSPSEAVQEDAAPIGPDDVIIGSGWPMPLGRGVNILAFGGSRGGKTRNVILPNILQCNANYIVNDPGGDLYDLCAHVLEQEGYTVQKLDIWHTSSQDAHWNPLDYVHNISDAMLLARWLVSGDSVDEEGFWRETEIGMLGKAIDQVCHESAVPAQSRTLKSVLQILDVISNTTSQAAAVLLQRLAYLRLQQAQEFTSRNDLDLSSFTHEKRAIFVITSRLDTTLNPLATTFFEMMDRKIRKKKEQGDRHVMVILDELHLLTGYADLDVKISTGRTYGISYLITEQNHPVMVESIGRNTTAVAMANFNAVLFLGGSDNEGTRDLLGKYRFCKRASRTAISDDRSYALTRDGLSEFIPYDVREHPRYVEQACGA